MEHNSDTTKQFKKLFNINAIGTKFWLNYHVKLLSNNNEQLCGFCHTNNKKKIKFELPCHHHVHCECAKERYDDDNCVICPICGVIEGNKYNYYCSSCNKWGKCDDDCMFDYVDY